MLPVPQGTQSSAIGAGGSSKSQRGALLLTQNSVSLNLTDAQLQAVDAALG